jgi:hypothetical protein
MGVDRLNLTLQVQSFGLNSLPSQLPHYKTNKNSEYRSLIPYVHNGIQVQFRHRKIIPTYGILLTMDPGFGTLLTPESKSGIGFYPHPES